MKVRTKTVVIVGVVVVAALAGFFILRPLFSRGDGITYVTRPVGYADIAATVSETGIVNPVTQVLIGSEVSGTIRVLNVDFNSKVRKGQVLAKLDPTTYQAAVDSAQANLMLSQANEESAVVNVGKMKAQLDLANLTVQRDQPLLTQGLINQNSMDTDRTAAQSAQQDYLAAQAQVRVAQAQIGVVKGQLAQAEYNLSKTLILSPFDGIVMARNVDVGQTVAASLQTPTLFTLATNLTDMQIDTSVDEADVGGLRQGETAQITVTAFPNVVFTGTVLQVRINPTTVQNVVTYDAVVQVHDTSGRLLPGMTAQVTIQVGSKTHVLAVPIAAVLYRPLAAPTTGAGGGFGGGGFGAGVVQSSGGAASQPVAGAPGSKVTIWKLVAGKPAPQQVVIGLSDGKNLEITSGGLNEGDRIIVAQRRGGAGGPSARNAVADGNSSAGGSGSRGGSGSGQGTGQGNGSGGNA
ncbi:MAG TPA: efflux RND transporter periplasmic adaptor subunit, partial [Spirochaetia bacterium]|nr:efflux RND transporter periplasmic adaptor subunit [Spirochaetia bacterium]